MAAPTPTIQAPQATSTEARIPRPPARTAPRRLLLDRAARWIVTAGGAAIILSVLGILLFILVEVWPLLDRADVAVAGIRTLPSGFILAVVGDEYRSHVVTLDDRGECRAFPVDGGVAACSRWMFRAGPVSVVRAAVAPGSPLLTAASADGKVALAPVAFETGYDGQRRVVTPRIDEPIVLDADPSGFPVKVFAAGLDADRGTATVAAILWDGSLVVVRREAREHLLTGEIAESTRRFRSDAPADLVALVLDTDQRNLFGATSGGRLVWWVLEDGQPGEPQFASAGPSAVTALTLLLGDRSLVVGQADGTLSVWFPVRQEDESFLLTRIRSFESHPGAIRWIVPSWRDKGFLAQDERGQLTLYHSTSKRVLWSGDSPLPSASNAFYLPKADGAFLVGDGRFAVLDIRNPHPEVSFRSLFGKVWYEGYPRPEFVWQSTGGTDDFESKMSLTPLLVGTLKGTLFSLILAIPLGVLGAMYTSQFMHPSLKRFVKPTVEIMAALPSVVLGFLAGLWLAPRVEKVIPGLLLILPVLVALVLLSRFLWHLVPKTVRGRLPMGGEVWLYLVATAVGVWICLAVSRPIEEFAFRGSFQTWLFHTTGLVYDQRNAVVVGLAMGFAVIPIIFAISEDAFSNVPRSLVAGSLALGANRWQTVVRVVLPTASPGIFSAIMVGFGRAVGETMIVLMATGNTPILDWSPFNGFRTLSANIAVEIPEAPHGGTLYRTLFLAGLLLFAVTFLVNTAAEIVRQRLRRRYAQL